MNRPGSGTHAAGGGADSGNTDATTGAVEHEAARGTEAAAIDVPERPALASNVELVGEMKETGFRDRQWLVRRDGRFIQLTELLYRIVEQANGERTLQEMAEGVTETTEWLVSAENVRQLLQSKLLPLGIIALTELPTDGSSLIREKHISGRPEGRSVSPLAVNGRMRLLGPRAIDPITKVLELLFAPFVLSGMLIAVALAHGWLYLAHGVGDAVLEVLYKPDLLLAVLAILFVSGVVHEFGHASALRYGGGKVRGMGAGFYLVYPALYTDTTDVYRLSRWGKVRTDLGGFYFHLIFAAGLVALYLVTRWEFLLFAVLLINLDILYQCMPFARFDGYWALADLSGIPDFFSQMGAFLRSVVPGLRQRGGALPDLKPWVKVVFALYIAVTVPMLSLLLLSLLENLPNILVASWNSFLLQAKETSFAIDEGDAAGLLMALLRVLILALQIAGIYYLVYAVGRAALRVLWRWSNPATPMRRVAGALLITLGIALLIFLFFWAP